MMLAVIISAHSASANSVRLLLSAPLAARYGRERHEYNGYECYGASSSINHNNFSRLFSSN